jgi:hypothetical protein
MLCVSSASDAAGDDAISRGHQILLNRGLQIQSEVRPYWGYSSVSRWQSANFTTFNVAEELAPTEIGQLPAGTQWGRLYTYTTPTTAPNVLTSDESPYATNFVSFAYGDEIKDLTSSTRLSDMATTFASWHSLYPNTLAYAGIAGGDYTTAQLTSYMAAAQPDMLMADLYPNYASLTGTYASPRAWYKSIQTQRLAALSGINGKPIPFGQWLEQWRTGYSAVLPSESFIRLQQNACWAFGCTFVSSFEYNDCAQFSDVYPVMFSSTGDSSPTKAFDYVAEANRQSRNLGPALVRLVSTDIRIVNGKVNGSQFQGNTGLSSWKKGNQSTGGYTDYITGITPLGKDKDNPSTTNYSDTLIGYFKPLLSVTPGCTFADGLHFMIVNGSVGLPFAADSSMGDAALNSAEWFRVDFDFGTSGFDSLVRLSRNTGLLELVSLQHLSGGDGALYRLDLQLDGGTGDLFRFWNSNDPLPTVPEPSESLLLGMGVIGMLACIWKKRR